MTFNRNNFAKMSAHENSNIPRLFGYSTTDLASEVQVAGYFDDLVNQVEVGDLIYAHVDTDGTPAFMLYPVVSNDGTTVDVSNGTAISATDSD